VRKTQFRVICRLLELLTPVSHAKMPTDIGPAPRRRNIVARISRKKGVGGTGSDAPKQMRHAPGGCQKFLRGIQYVGAEAQQVAPRVSDHSFF
jgi:hypothetical protein